MPPRLEGGGLAKPPNFGHALRRRLAAAFVELAQEARGGLVLLRESRQCPRHQFESRRVCSLALKAQPRECLRATAKVGGQVQGRVRAWES